MLIISESGKENTNVQCNNYSLTFLQFENFKLKIGEEVNKESLKHKNE